MLGDLREVSVETDCIRCAARHRSATRISGAAATYTTTLAEITAIPPTDPRVPGLVKDLEKAIATIDTSSIAFATKSDAYAKDTNRDIAAAYTSSRTTILAALLLATLLGLAIDLRISAQVKQGVTRIQAQLRSLRERDTASLRDGLDAISRGDLTHRAVAVTETAAKLPGDEIGDIGRTVNEITADTSTSIFL